MANEYSKSWFQIFMESKTPLETEKEVKFIMKHLPIEKYRRILDICCGYGRHSNVLAQSGYNVIGIDKDKGALAHAEGQANENAKYIQYDMRNIGALPYSFDAVICMWQSFGYFEQSVNINILKQVSNLLKEEGRFILDIYNKAYFENNIGTREFNKQGILITEKVEKQGNRFNVALSYNDSTNIADEFNWYLYSKNEIIDLCKNYGLVCNAACTWCDDGQPVTDSTPRMQLVFEKR